MRFIVVSCDAEIHLYYIVQYKQLIKKVGQNTYQIPGTFTEM